MAPLPQNNTGRLFVDYTDGIKPHTLMVRYGAGGDVAGAMTAADAFLDALSPIIRTITIEGARHAAQGDNVSLPIAWTGNTGYGTGVAAPYESAWFIDFVGRTIGGRRVRAAVFACTLLQVGNDYRATSVENANVDNALTAIRADVDSFVAIDGLEAVWNNYANLGVNAYWRNKIR